ncbi:MAG TPA: dienelactone hydrolase family protein, partial [Burkholderiales bacterium]|nr:dienelactone hydrolase family protein [Burkholderiales bacterium]
MRLSAIAVPIMLMALLLPLPAHAQTARIELHAFRSTTLTDQQFLNGVKEGQPVTIAGELRLPRARTSRLPAVVLLHGSGGLSASHAAWAEELTGMGIAVFLVDSFTGRGIVSVSASQDTLGRLAMIIDAYRALDLLAPDSRIDADRIALMGFSRGGQSVLYASLRRFQKMHGPPGIEFAAYIPFYPSCNTRFRDDENVTGRPVHIHHGLDDNYVPIEPCQAYVDRLYAAGKKNVVLTEYPGAHHSFDNPANPTPVRAERSQSTALCVLQEDGNGRVINSKTGKPFSYRDTCVRLGPTVGYNAEQHAAAVKSVKEFLA